MKFHDIEARFREKVCKEITLVPEGVDRYLVLTPFYFDDGDHPKVVLKTWGKGWIITDEGNTFMRLTYDLDDRDLETGTRAAIIQRVVALYGVQEQGGRLVIPIVDENYGDALFSFIQAVLRVSDVSYLTRERVLSTFVDDIKRFLAESISKERLAFDWNEPTQDPDGNYPVDCRISGTRKPVMVFALTNDDRVQTATITLLQFEKWGLDCESVGFFEDQTTIGRRPLARFSDVVGKQVTSIAGRHKFLELVRS